MAVLSFSAVLLTALALAPQDALGHGWMGVPASRHLCNVPKLGRFTMGGGLSKTGFCGWAEQDANACEPQETYQEGGVIAMSYGIRANHGGFLKCRICTDPDNMSEECFNQHILQTVNHPHPDRWYIREDDSAQGEFWDSEWQLPQGLVCDHCVMSCSWYCAQHCSIPCEESECGPFYSQGRNPYGTRGPDVVYKECPAGWLERTTGNRDPQTFTNCADIRIQGGGGGAPALPPAGSEEEMSLDEQTEMADEEEDETGLDVSPAGMADDLTCGDDKVAGVLLALNEARADEDMPRLTCSDRSTGTAANWAYLVAENGEVSSDMAANCRMSRFGEECLEVVVRTDPGTDVLETEEVMQSNLISVEATHVGIGYIEQDGAVWWTILAGSDSEDPVTVEATPEEEEVVPVATPFMNGGGDASCCPADRSACICGACNAPLPPGQVVACSADSEGKSCCDGDSGSGTGEEEAEEADLPAQPTGGQKQATLGSWLAYWSSRN